MPLKEGMMLIDMRKALHKNEINQNLGFSSPMSNKNHFGSGYNVDNIHGVLYIRLEENFKLIGY